MLLAASPIVAEIGWWVIRLPQIERHASSLPEIWMPKHSPTLSLTFALDSLLISIITFTRFRLWRKVPTHLYSASWFLPLDRQSFTCVRNSLPSYSNIRLCPGSRWLLRLAPRYISMLCPERVCTVSSSKSLYNTPHNFHWNYCTCEKIDIPILSLIHIHSKDQSTWHRQQ